MKFSKVDLDSVDPLQYHNTIVPEQKPNFGENYTAVKELFLHFGQRQSIPLGPWAAACPSMRRMHLCTDSSAALGDVVRVSESYCVWLGVG